MKTALFIALGIFTVGFIVVWVTAVLSAPGRIERPKLVDYLIGLGVNFLDTLGIGSFATMSACFKLFGLVRDEQIPGTLNVSATIPGVTEAFIYIAVVDVDVTTLTSMIAAFRGRRVAGRGSGFPLAPAQDSDWHGACVVDHRGVRPRDATASAPGRR